MKAGSWKHSPEAWPSIEWFSRIPPREFQGAWSPRPRYVKCIQDALYWDLAGRAMIQGRLQRRIEKQKRGEYWREGWCLLVGNELWMFALPLGDAADGVPIAPPTSFNLSFVNDSSISFVDSTSFSLSFAGEKEVFRAKTSLDAKRWMLTLASYFHRRISTISPQFQSHGATAAQEYIENDILASMETTICMAERDSAVKRFQLAEQCFSFEGALNNYSIRTVFVDFLRKQREDTLLLFWEYAEDFRLGHPDSPHPYERKDLAMLGTIATNQYNAISSIFLNMQAVCCLPLDPLPSPSGSVSSPMAFAEIQTLVLARLRDWFAVFSQSPGFKLQCAALQHGARSPPPRRAEAVAASSASSSSPQPQPSQSIRLRFGLRPASTPVVSSSPAPSAVTISVEQRAELQQLRSSLTNNQSKSPPASLPHWWWDQCVVLSSNEDAVSALNVERPHWQAYPLSRALSQYEQLQKSKGEEFAIADHIAALPEALQDLFSTVTIETIASAPNQHIAGFGAVLLTSTMAIHCIPKPKPRATYFLSSAPPTGSSLASVRLDSAALTAHINDGEGVEDPEPSAVRNMAQVWVDYFSGGLVRTIAILTVAFGHARMYLLEPLSSRLMACVRLQDMVRIGPADKNLQAIEMFDEDGCCWQLSPEGLDEVDSQNVRIRWLRTLSSIYRSPAPVFMVVKRGVLLKKGQVNTSFKPRYCELSSDLKLRYFKCDGNWSYKGQIDLILLDRFTLNRKDDLSRFEQLICMSMMRTNRLWILKAASEAEADQWISAMEDLLQSWGSRGRSGEANGDDTVESTLSSDEESDHE